MSRRVLGTKGAIEQGKEYSGGPGQPTVTVRRWEGTKEDMLIKLAEVQNEGWVFRLRENGPIAELIAETPSLPGSDPGTAIISDTWEMLPGEAEKDLLETDLTAINALSITQKENIRSKVADSNFPITFVPNSISEVVYKLMLMGRRSKILFAPVLRNTITVSNSFNDSAVTARAVANVGRIIKASTIYEEFGLPAGFLIALNNPPFSTSTGALISVQRDGLTFNYGFLKKYPTLHQVVGGRLQIVQEWQFGLWEETIELVPV